MLRRCLLTHGMTLSSYLGYPLGNAMRLLRDSQTWTAEEMQVHQSRALNALMRHCYDHVPYYRDLMRIQEFTSRRLSIGQRSCQIALSYP